MKFFGKIGVLWIGVVLLAACGAADEPPDNAAQLAQGEAVYNQYCAECHGIDGEGQPNWQRPGPDGRLPAPPHDSAGHTWHHPDQQLLGIIARGGLLPNSDMPGYEGILTEEEMVAVLEYIKTFWGPEELEFQRRVTEMDAQ